MGAVSYFLVFLAIVLIGVAAWAGAGGNFGTLFRRSRTGPNVNTGLPNEAYLEAGLLDGGFEQPVANLPPVLLPADASPADVDRVRFSLGLRGYRMDQVDQVLDELRDQLAAKQEEVERLRTRLLEAERSLRSAATGEPVIGEPVIVEPLTVESPSVEPTTVEPPAAEGGTRAPDEEREQDQTTPRHEREKAEGTL